MIGYKGGTIEAIVGPMFAGKTEELIRRLTRAQYANQKIIVFKPIIDNRHSEDKIISHNGREIKSIAVNSASDIYEKAIKGINNLERDNFSRGDLNYDVIAIDEVQFFDEEILFAVNFLANLGARIIVTGLDMDFKGEPFGVMPNLLAIAERVDKLTAICRCGAFATISQRLINGKPAKYDSPTVMVGAEESYESRCRACHEVDYDA